MPGPFCFLIGGVTTGRWPLPLLDIDEGVLLFVDELDAFVDVDVLFSRCALLGSFCLVGVPVGNGGVRLAEGLFMSSNMLGLAGTDAVDDVGTDSKPDFFLLASILSACFDDIDARDLL